MSEFEVIAIEPIQAELRNTSVKNKYSFSDLWDAIKQSNIHVIGVQKKRKRQNRKQLEEIRPQIFQT